MVSEPEQIQTEPTPPQIEKVPYQVLTSSATHTFTGGKFQEQLQQWLETNMWRIPEGEILTILVQCEVLMPYQPTIAPTPFPYLDFDHH